MTLLRTWIPFGFTGRYIVNDVLTTGLAPDSGSSQLLTLMYFFYTTPAVVCVVMMALTWGVGLYLNFFYLSLCDLFDFEPPSLVWKGERICVYPLLLLDPMLLIGDPNGPLPDRKPAS